MIDFSVEPEFQAKLDWMNTFVREECETMDLLFPEMGAALRYQAHSIPPPPQAVAGSG